MKKNVKLTDFLEKKAFDVRRRTLSIHGLAPETRVASSLSCVEIFVALYYGKILKFKATDLQWDKRDRFIISKGHGAISLYPILADLGFFSKYELLKVGTKDSFLGGIPDPVIPGFETVNGSLGHGLGVACGIAVGLKRKKKKESVFVLNGDGEMSEGSVWEAIMFAGHHKLDNITLIVDNNKIGMLDYCKNVIDLAPLEEKFKVFGWHSETVDGHNMQKVYDILKYLKEKRTNKPKVLIADTIKGKGVPSLECDVLCHIRNLSKNEIDKLLKDKEF
ncbi:MAG: transketolase [Candidatus Omnitrophica bacterium]|nr:transketolase [Candidatus Omnitrophota bacterium]